MLAMKNEFNIEVTHDMTLRDEALFSMNLLNTKTDSEKINRKFLSYS